MKATIIVPPPIQPPKTVVLELTELEARILSTMTKNSIRGVTLQSPDWQHPYDDAKGLTWEAIKAMMDDMRDLQGKFPPFPLLRFDR